MWVCEGFSTQNRNPQMYIIYIFFLFYSSCNNVFIVKLHKLYMFVLGKYSILAKYAKK